MRLSDRLQMLADQIQLGESMADIGTDHGFLPIYLTEQGISPHVVLTDISKGSLEKALEDCRAYDACREFDLRWGDGLTVLAPGEVDAVVIAGMGGILMAEILEKDPALSRSFGKLILQPRNHAGLLRYRLGKLGFVIERELLVQERRRICEILVARPGGPVDQAGLPSYEDSPEVYDYPDGLVDQAGELTGTYLLHALGKQERNLARMSQAKNIDKHAVEVTEARIRRLRALTGEVMRLEQS